MNSGPIMQDRHSSTRPASGSGNEPGIFYNKNAGDITKWTYDPDFTRPANNSSSGSITPTLRLTAQLNRRMQVGVFVDGGAFRLSDYPQIGQVGAVPLATPETGTVGGSGRSDVSAWSWTVTSRLLLDASYGSYHQDWNGREAAWQQSRPDSHDGTVHGRLREQRRRRPGPGLSRAGVERRLHGAEPLAGGGDLSPAHTT